MNIDFHEIRPLQIGKPWNWGMQQIILTTQLKDLSMFSNVTHIGYCMKLKRGETEMDGSGILNCELMNLVKKRVACRDRIVELHDKYTQDKLNKMVGSFDCFKTSR